jgi:Tat protein secretion system quality control protein TatD with DNase activity
MPTDTKWKVAVGMHPKKVAKCTEAQVKQFFDLIKNHRVSAIGEVGLDTSLRDGTRKAQEDFLQEVLKQVKPKTPLILHIRSTRPDRYSKWLYLRALGMLKQHCHPTQNIIYICFTGDDSVRAEWSNQFPNGFFSFSSILKRFDEEQLKAVKKHPSYSPVGRD